jgi:hypothetical protein
MKITPHFVPFHRALLPGLVLLFFTVTPAGWAQSPPLGTNLRSAASSTRSQADIVTRAAENWSRRANSASYNVGQFQADFANIQMQFQGLREQFNWVGGLARQLGRARADNAVAELDAGLSVIAELFTFLQNQFSAGTLDRNTIVRTARAFEDAMRVWQREFVRCSSRLGVA